MYDTRLHPNCDLKWTYFLRDANLRSTSQLGALSERTLELVKDLLEGEVVNGWHMSHAVRR